MRLHVSDEESRRIRALFSRKKPDDNASAGPPEDSSRVQETAHATNKRWSPDTEVVEAGMCSPCEKKPRNGSTSQPVRPHDPSAGVRHSTEQRRIAQSEMEAKSVDLLVLDQTIPKKAKDGAAMLFGKTAQGSSVIVSISGFRPYFFFPAPKCESGKPLTQLQVDELLSALNKSCADKTTTAPVAQIEIEARTEAMYYRTTSSSFLKIIVETQEKMKKVIDTITKFAGGTGPGGLRWPAGSEAWETNVSAQLRFFSELAISGGSWIRVPARRRDKTPSNSRCLIELQCTFDEVESLTYDIADLLFPASCEKKSTSQLDRVAPLRVMTLAVTPLPPPAVDKSPVKAKGKGKSVDDERGASFAGSAGMSVTASADKDPVGIIACSVADVYGGGSGKASPSKGSVAFIVRHNDPMLQGKGRAEGMGTECLDNAETRYYDSEREMICGWLAWALDADADCWATFEAQRSLGYLEKRASALKLRFDCGRLAGATTCLRSVQTYGKQWNARGGMASASLETFKADNLHGRVFLDVLRLATSKYKSDFHTASFGEVVSRLLHRPYRQLSPGEITSLFRDTKEGLEQATAACVADAELILDLFFAMNTLPDTMELSRVTGLSLQDILFKAEMVKVHSVLLRVAHRHERRYILPSTYGGGQLNEGPHVIDPREKQTAGFYPEDKGAVVICDFQSLYPSVMISKNLCYTTLIAGKDDLESIGLARCQQAPAAESGSGSPGSWFCDSSVQKGLFPMILDRLLMLRAAAKKQLLEAGLSHIERKALQGRERALKLCANASYGFAGASTSPCQSVAVAEAVLLHGAAMCRRAIGLAQSPELAERLGLDRPRVLYAQTDSIFVLLPEKSVLDASQVGGMLASIITEEISEPPVKLNYETCVSNFLLQAVNRYAAKGSDGSLLAKGVETDRRDVPGIMRRITTEALNALLVEGDADKAVRVCAVLIRDLLKGRVAVSDLTMTGGLLRYTGKDIRNEANAAGSAPAASGGEDATGPAAKVAVKMVSRDPGRSFAAGERVPFVFLSGPGAQQDRAEEPWLAVRKDLPVDYSLYWSHKISPPLKRLLEPALTQKQMKDLFTGSHTQVKAISASTAAGKMGSFFKSMPKSSASSASKTPEKVAEDELLVPVDRRCRCNHDALTCLCDHQHCICIHW